ncbi:hypothetical protein D3C87_1928880 [compost metagenome]
MAGYFRVGGAQSGGLVTGREGIDGDRTLVITEEGERLTHETDCWIAQQRQQCDEGVGAYAAVFVDLKRQSPRI